ncbi:transcriptional regulator [Desulforegula conservatrix]|uniref:transcriptional regulator n=1 Tax=Desulforegula conservatrix TaxID=153026 RepID=UPI000429137C|nr:ArsR family transcriptional regulator [Desulforegula conservatrix]
MGTVRQRIVECLEDREMTVRDLSKTLHVSETDVMDHLSHISISVKTQNKKLRINPSQCGICGFIFKDRSRPSKPGKCPGCRNTKISPASFWIR